MDFIEIEILNWEKYNPRRDYKKPWWFALSNTITSDAMFSEFSDAEFKAWIHILCTASVQNTYRPKIFFKHAERSACINKKHIHSVISKLEILQVIRIPARICTESVRDLYATEHNSTVHNKHNNNAHAGAFADFWLGYPKKQGKSGAEKKFKAAIKAGVSPEEICQARDRYRDHLKREGTEAKFILHGSTFMGQWRDWLDPAAGTVDGVAKKKTTLEIIQEVYDGSPNAGNESDQPA